MSQPYWSPPQNLPHTFRCANHPEREGVGICVSCRGTVCVECSTKIDRMNYCIRCLQSAAPDRAADVVNPAREALLGVPLLLASFIGAVGVFAALGFVLALLRR
ncbi:MAG: hypothetical protein ACO1SX_21480 [Actinomycetota bacterium]